MLQEEIAIVIGTNRPNSLSLKLGMFYKHLLEDLSVTVKIIDLAELPTDFAFGALYQNQGKNADFNVFQSQMDSTTKFIFIVPEYNGSFPGVLKTFFDGLRYPDTMKNKKVALVGLSAGVLGNAVGLGHLSDILSYMGANVLGLRMKLGSLHANFENGKVSNEVYLGFIRNQIDLFLKF